MIPPDLKIETAEQAAAFWREHVATKSGFRPDVEWSVVLLLDRERRLMDYTSHSDGAGEWVLSPVGDPLRAALIAGASGLIIMHNHTINDLRPSNHDHNQVQAFLAAARLFGLTLHDSVIIDLGGHHFSFADRGLLEMSRAVQSEADESSFEAAWFTVAGQVLEPHPWLKALVAEAAARAGATIDVYLGHFLIRSLDEYFRPQPTEDQRLAFSAGLFAIDDPRMAVVIDEARRAGCGVSAFLWSVGLEETRKRFT